LKSLLACSPTNHASWVTPDRSLARNPHCRTTIVASFATLKSSFAAIEPSFGSNVASFAAIEPSFALWIQSHQFS
jgi:hypothetical protein